MSKIQIIKIYKLGKAYTQILAGLKLEKDLILQLLLEDIMQESTIYQYILQKGEKIGEQRSEQKQALKYTLRLLNRRFGNIDSLILERLKILSTEQLESLGEALLDFSSVSDLVPWLEQNTNI